MGIERTHIARFGGRSKPSFQDFNVINLPKRKMMFWDGQEDVDDWETMTTHYKNRLNSRLSEEFMFRTTDFRHILSYIESKDPEFFATFQVPAPEDRVTRVGPLGKPVGPPSHYSCSIYYSARPLEWHLSPSVTPYTP